MRIPICPSAVANRRAGPPDVGFSAIVTIRNRPGDPCAKVSFLPATPRNCWIIPRFFASSAICCSFRRPYRTSARGVLDYFPSSSFAAIAAISAIPFLLDLEAELLMPSSSAPGSLMRALVDVLFAAAPYTGL